MYTYTYLYIYTYSNIHIHIYIYTYKHMFIADIYICIHVESKMSVKYMLCIYIYIKYEHPLSKMHMFQWTKYEKVGTRFVALWSGAFLVFHSGRMCRVTWTFIRYLLHLAAKKWCTLHGTICSMSQNLFEVHSYHRMGQKLVPQTGGFGE